MATGDSDWTLQGLDNPLQIQHTLLTRFEKETGAAIVDNNNPASVIMESCATTVADAMRMLDENVRPALYPARAVNTSDLLRHISNYDYVDIFSAPCQATILLIIEKSYLISHSVEVPGKDYRKLLIPRSTQIQIGEHTFGLYYPIEFRSSLKSGQFSVMYDTSIPNPLKALETNVLEFDFREYNGHKLAYIKVPVYQFKTVSHELTMTNHAGFKQNIQYEDRFYALRCWADVLTNWGHDDTEQDKWERKELELAVAGQTYDPTTPTIIFTPDEENKEVTLEVPYVYFMEGRIRGVLHVDIYTTEGELDYKVPYNTTETCVINMFANLTDDEMTSYDVATYATPFQAMPALDALPFTSHIVGGSNGLTFEQIRQRVIKGVETNVLQTPADISAYFAAYGYTATLYRDGITDRIFIVHAAVRDDEGAIVAMDCIPTLFDFTKIDEYGTIVKTPDSQSTYTILPSTLYKFDKDRKICLPLTDVERNALANLPAADRVDKYNNNVFTLSPFHLQIDAASKYPTTITYDMLECKRLSRTFVAARDTQYGLALNTVNLDIYRREGDVMDRYRLLFRVSRVGFSNLIKVQEDGTLGQVEKKIRVLVGLKNDDGEFHWAEAQWLHTEEGDTENNDNEVFELILTPNYVFHQANNEHTVQMTFWDNNVYSDFYLTSEARVVLLLRDGLDLSKTSTLGTNESESPIYFEGDKCLETKFTSSQMVLPTSKRIPVTSEVGLINYFAMTEQKCVFQFGSPIDELDQRINLTYSEAVYKKHLTTKFRTLESDKYSTDDRGNLKLAYSYTKVGPDTDHKYFVKGVNYFVQDGEIYIPASVEDVVYNELIPDTKEFFIKDVSPQIEVLFPKGTLTCMTVMDKEKVSLNKYLIDNYLGRHKATEAGAGDALDQAALETAISEGKDVDVFDCPTVPRFIVESADKENKPLLGKFELKDALTAKPISSMDNVWVMPGDRGTTKIGEDDRHLFTKITSNSALDFVMSHLAKEAVALSDDKDPLETFTGDKKFQIGTFLLLSNDYSEPEKIQIKGCIGPDPVTEKSKVYTRLYYKLRDLTDDELNSKMHERESWICLVQGKSKTDMLAFLADEASGQNPKYYGLMSLWATYYGDLLERGHVDTLHQLHYVAFLTKMDYNAKTEAYLPVDQSTEIVISTQRYYIESAEGTFREATEADFNDDGSFRSDVTYFIYKVGSASYKIPDFQPIEKSAWESHVSYDPITEEEDLFVVAGKSYCYKDKDAYTDGFTKWVELSGMTPGEPITNYIDIETQTGDGKVYFKKTFATCTDTDYAWEQNANRWPWEIDNWQMVKAVYESNDRDVKYFYLTTDSDLVLKSDWDRLHRYWEYSADQVILDEHFKPLEDYEKPRAIQYLCDMLQMDAKLAQVTTVKEDTSVGSDFGPDDESSRRYPSTVVKILRTYFDNIGNARDTMFTNSRLFFEPVKSLGYADFNVGNNVTKELSLDITMKFRLHVTKDAYEDDVLLIQMKKQIIKLIDTQIDSGHVNCAEIAAKITEEMDGTVKWVDVLGINGDPDLQTMKCDSKDVRPHLAHRLELSDDNSTIDVTRGLIIEAVINE